MRIFLSSFHSTDHNQHYVSFSQDLLCQAQILIYLLNLNMLNNSARRLDLSHNHQQSMYCTNFRLHTLDLKSSLSHCGGDIKMLWMPTRLLSEQTKKQILLCSLQRIIAKGTDHSWIQTVAILFIDKNTCHGPTLSKVHHDSILHEFLWRG